MGPAVAQLPAASQTVAELVAAAAVSVPAGTDVVRLSCAWAGVARPDRVSLAVQATVTSLELQALLGAAQATAGAVRSTWTERFWVGLVAPALSVAQKLSVVAPSALTTTWVAEPGATVCGVVWAPVEL